MEDRKTTYVIGDVHGCLEALKMAVALIETRRLEDGGEHVRLVFVGDLIDKGPDSLGVLRYVQAITQRFYYEVVVVMGNHEEKLLRYLSKIEEAPDYIQELAARLTENDLKFMEEMPLTYRVPGYNATVVHGGVLPKHEKLAGQFSNKEKKILGRVARVRFIRGDDEHYQEARVYDAEGKKIGKHKSCDAGPMPVAPDGGRIELVNLVNPKDEFIPLGEEGPNDVFWAERYDGRFGTILFGHQPFNKENLPSFQYAVALDWGCVFGGHLAFCRLVHKEDREPYKQPMADAVPGTTLFYDVDCVKAVCHADPIPDTDGFQRMSRPTTEEWLEGRDPKDPLIQMMVKMRDHFWEKHELNDHDLHSLNLFRGQESARFPLELTPEESEQFRLLGQAETDLARDFWEEHPEYEIDDYDMYKKSYDFLPNEVDDED